MDLFTYDRSQNQKLAPLADRMRPRTLQEFIGQEAIVGPGRLLRRAIEADRLTSSIFWGPPGTGKTTLASIIANQTRSEFVKLNAVTSGVADVREVIKAAESREKRLEKIVRLEKPVSEDKVRFSFEARRRTGDDVLKVHGLAKGFEGRRLFENFDLHLRAGDRVAIIGPNGVGKSTLLNIIARKLKADAGEVEFGANVDLGYYEQHQTGLDPEKDVLNELWDAFPRLDLDRVRSVLALFLFTGDDVYKKISMLSGGEKGRVSLCKLMLKRDNLLLLDEPTNHLDMDSREVLEGALEDFDGTILTVSHDRYFINRVADRIIEMRPDGVKEYLGNYDDYLEKKRREEAGLEDAAASGMTKTQLDKQRRRERLLREGKKALEKQLEAAEARIAAAEKEIQDLEARMADPELYQRPDEARETARRHAELQAGMDALYEEWEALSEAVSER